MKDKSKLKKKHKPASVIEKENKQPEKFIPIYWIVTKIDRGRTESDFINNCINGPNPDLDVMLEFDPSDFYNASILYSDKEGEEKILYQWNTHENEWTLCE